MRFENAFEVDAPVDTVWEALLDVERVAPNVPGAEVLERTDENAYKVGIKVKLGPITMNYRGDLQIVERDDAAHRAVMRVKAKEARGQGTADADVTTVLGGDGDHTSVSITSDVRLSGRAAAMSRGIVQDVAGRLIDTFAQNLEQMLAGKPAEAEPEPAAAAAPPVEPAPAAAAPPPPPPPPRREPEPLDVGNLAGEVVAARLRDPRALALALALAALLGYALGRRR
ncbi:MAG TPA: SRPBCC family protein [Solirubrobacteraceae bacterium]